MPEEIRRVVNVKRILAIMPGSPSIENAVYYVYLAQTSIILFSCQPETEYDELLGDGSERWEARSEVEFKVRSVLLNWEGIPIQ